MTLLNSDLPDGKVQDHRHHFDPSLPGVADELLFESMVNLEVGVATGFQFDKWKKNVTEMGRLSDIEGRYGWFVPKDMENRFPYLQSWKVGTGCANLQT